jgi:predicted metal-dependent HD superfamily phosphohydrolase
MSSINDQGHQQWHDLLRTWNVNRLKADAQFDEVRKAYAGPSRFYHNLDHVLAVLGTVESLVSYAKNVDAVKLAAWLHDLIYDSKASDNEDLSAESAEEFCKELAIPDGHRVAALIRMTKTHDAGDDVDAKVLLDADLAVLGASHAEYQAYEENIRREYAWVPEPEYRKGRRQVLERFLSRPRIYHFLSHLEEPARRNLEAEIARLSLQPRTLTVLPDTYAVSRLSAEAAVPTWATTGNFLSITRTAHELSVVCLQSLVPDGVRCERDWRCLQLAGPIPFSTIGVLASLVQPLAGAGISVFAVSTFDTDYLLVKENDLKRALAVLCDAGHEVG